MAISFKIKNSEFRNKIEIQELTEMLDSDNIPVKDWQTVRTCNAKIVHNSGKELDVSSGLMSTMDTKIYIRYSANPVLNSKKHRILYKNQIYDIKFVTNIQEANVYYQIVAEVREA